MNLKKKKFFDSRKGSQLRSQNRKTTDLGCRTEFFFLWKKQFIIVFLEVKLTGDYRNVAIIPTLLQDYRKKMKKPYFSLLSDFWPWSRNNYVMIPTTWQFPANFTLKNYTSKLNFEIKNFRFPKGVSGSVSKSRKRPFWDIGRNFFLWKSKIIIVFFGVNFTGEYRNVAIIPTLLRDHRQKSKKPNFLLFFRLLTVIPK